MNYGEKWKFFRKLIHQEFNERRCEREHITLQNAEAVQMLKDFLVEPEGLMGHPRRFSNSIIMSLGKLHLRSQSETTVRSADRTTNAQCWVFEVIHRKPHIWWSFLN